MRAPSVDQAFEYLLKLVEVLRPKFYNRLTWVIVICGLAMMSSPLWERVLEALLSQSLNLSITKGGDVKWGFALVLVGVVYHVVTTSLFHLTTQFVEAPKVQARAAHDKAIFEAFASRLDEKWLNGFINWLLVDHSYMSDEEERLRLAVEFLSEASNNFLDPKIQAKAEAFKTAITTFLKFTSNFDTFPYNQTERPYRICLAPTLNMDRAGSGSTEAVAKYDGLALELDQISSEMTGCYREFRNEIKQQLAI